MLYADGLFSEMKCVFELTQILRVGLQRKRSLGTVSVDGIPAT